MIFETPSSVPKLRVNSKEPSAAPSKGSEPLTAIDVLEKIKATNILAIRMVFLNLLSGRSLIIAPTPGKSLTPVFSRGLTVPRRGQNECDPGVIIMGYKGDPVFDSTDPDIHKRPTWTRDGTFMVFRKLEQDVKGFEDYCRQKYVRRKDLTFQEGADLWGARVVGRWKSVS